MKDETASKISKDRNEETSSNPCPLVSVLIPTYNRAGVLGRAIESVLTQTFPDFELIVVDDGSTDNTVEVVQGFRDPRVRLVRLATNCGLSRARNEGIRAARGEFVAFLDDDDEWLPRKLALQVARLRESDDPQTSVVYCRSLQTDELTRATVPHHGVIHEGDVFDALIRGWFPRSPSLFMVKRSSLLSVGCFDEALPSASDYDLWLRLAEASNHFVAVGEPLVIKHENAGPQLSSDPVTKLRAGQLMIRKWGAVIKRDVGAAAYRRWKATRYANVQFAHFRRVKMAVARGERWAAFRHWLAMCRLLPWSRRFIIQALVCVTLGWRVYGALARARGQLIRVCSWAGRG
jgi:glycosyltransferase involved in cell wall biosynthesis